MGFFHWEKLKLSLVSFSPITVKASCLSALLLLTTTGLWILPEHMAWHFSPCLFFVHRTENVRLLHICRLFIHAGLIGAGISKTCFACQSLIKKRDSLAQWWLCCAPGRWCSLCWKSEAIYPNSICRYRPCKVKVRSMFYKEIILPSKSNSRSKPGLEEKAPVWALRQWKNSSKS